MTIKVGGSVRVDLVGGTLDINPINLILNDVVTINLATSLKAKVSVVPIKGDEIIIDSIDYNSTKRFTLEQIRKCNEKDFGPLYFVGLIINYFYPDMGLKITLESGSPTGAGLGGSSSMGVTLYKALCQFFNSDFDRLAAIKIVSGIEAKILNCGPTGYQDYYPAVYGGVLALHPQFDGVEVEQLYSPELKKYLEENLTLIYSGDTRLSGINNWEVFKGFFDNDQTRVGLQSISDVSKSAYNAIKDKDFNKLSEMISKEGELRAKLFPGIVTEKIQNFFCELSKDLNGIGLKVCGAGGGGCFLLSHEKKDKKIVTEMIAKHEMKELEFSVESPL